MFATYRPYNTSVSVRIATVNFILVVQVYCIVKSYRGILDPFQYIFGPVHPQVFVHAIAFNNLTLTGIPQLVMRLRMFQFLEAIVPGTGVKRVFP
jgi:hypothetical protein